MKDIIRGIQQQMDSFLEEVKIYPCYPKIEEKMTEAIKRIDYPFKDISFLMLAFCRVKIEIQESGKNNATYRNDTLAQIGDAVLDLILTEQSISQGKGKKEIDDRRQTMAKNEHLFSISKSKDLKQFCYHKKYFYGDAPQEDRVSAGNHDSIVEAIIGAIYFDGGLDQAREWVLKTVLNQN